MFGRVARSALISTLILLLAGILFYPMKPWFADEGKPKALVVKVEGKPTYTRNGKSFPVISKLVLKTNDTVQAPKGSVATVMLGSGITCRIGSDTMDTKMVISELDKVGKGNKASVDVKSGTVAAMVNSKEQKQNFTINTPTAVASVRGTSFLVDASKDSTALMVDEGGVEFENALGKDGDKALVEAGSKAVSDLGGIEVSLLLAYEKARLEVLDTLEVFDTDYYEDSIGEAFDAVGDTMKDGIDSLDKLRKDL